MKSGRDTAKTFPVEPRRIMSAGRTRPPERTLEAGRAKIRLWNGRAYRGGPGERQAWRYAAIDGWCLAGLTVTTPPARFGLAEFVTVQIESAVEEAYES